MAIITISRKIASLGDETAQELANLLGYKFITRKTLERDLLKRGFSQSVLKKYDERKPGFWASISRERDQYFDFLREIVFTHAQEDNCIFIGRGGFAMLKDAPGCYSVRLVASDDVRLKRIMEEFNWSEQKAQNLITESDNNRDGFHKCFFNVTYDDSSLYDMVLNTSEITAKTAAEIVKAGFEKTIDNVDEAKIKEYVAHRLLGQKIVNAIAFEHKLPVFFLDAEVSDSKIILHGVTESSGIVEKVIAIATEFSDGRKVESDINSVNNYTVNTKGVGF